MRPLCGQAPHVAQPEGRPVDDIDDSDDIDDPRTEGRRRKVRAGSGTPESARKAEGEGCTLRRRVVDVVDVVVSSSGGRSKGQAAGAERSEKRRTPPRARGGVLAKTGSFVVQGFRVAGWLRGLRDGAKSTTRPRRGQAPQAAQPEGRPVDDRTKGPQDERSRPRRLRPPGPKRSEKRRTPPRARGGVLAKKGPFVVQGFRVAGLLRGVSVRGGFWRIPAQKGSQGECRFVVPSSESAADRRSCNCGSGGSPRS